MNQVDANLADASDKFDAMGRNGAQHTFEAFDDVTDHLAQPNGTPIRANENINMNLPNHKMP